MASGNASLWPEGCLGAVSLTFDDGMTSQLEVAIPMLDEHGLEATFYVPPRHENWREGLLPWRDVVRAGHEVGNHTVSHPCSGNFPFTPEGRGLEVMTLEEIEADVLEASRRLREVIPEQETCTFCYPCYQDYVGEGVRRQSYVPVIARHFPAARGKGERATNQPRACDLHYLWSMPCERMSGPELVGLAESASEGYWAILTFHGISEGKLSVTETDLQELCAFLARHRDRLWVAPVVAVAQRVAAWRQERYLPTRR